MYDCYLSHTYVYVHARTHTHTYTHMHAHVQELPTRVFKAHLFQHHFAVGAARELSLTYRVCVCVCLFVYIDMCTCLLSVSEGGRTHDNIFMGMCV